MKLSILYGVWVAIQLLAGYNLLLPFFLFCWYKLFPKKDLVGTKTSQEADYAIIVTAYEQTDTLREAVNSILQLHYRNFLVYVVADKCDITGLAFDDNRVFIFRPEEALNSNTKSHFYAIDRFKRHHDYLTIIDSDNLVEPEYLNKLNDYFGKGFIAVQGIRKAKNMDTTYACLDAARDMYYHFYDGEILFHIGSSTTLSGSGMAFTTKLYRECLEHLEVTGAGFDKKLQVEIVERGERIAFTRDAIVFDEKTSMTDQLVKQRARWINAWFKYFLLGFGLLRKGIANRNLNQFLFAVMLVRPPLFIFLLLSLSFLIINIVTGGVLTAFWIIGFLLFILSFIIALLSFKADKKIFTSLLNIPTFMFYQVLSLLKVRKANQYSVATKHFHNKKIDEVIKGSIIPDQLMKRNLPFRNKPSLMRIGIEAQRIFRPKKHGLEVVVIELIRELQKLDKQNEYVIFIKPDTDSGAVQETDNFKIKLIPGFSYPEWEQLRLPTNAKKEKLDFLHCTSNTAPLRCPVPLLLTLHDIIYLEKIDFRGSSYQDFGNIYRRFIVKNIINRTKLITTVSEWEKQTIIEKFKLPSDKVEVIYNAVNPMFHNRFSSEEIAGFKERYKLPERFILYLGNTAPKKNTYNVIRGFVEYCLSCRTNMPLVLLDYDQSLVERILLELNARHLLPLICFPGYIPHGLMPLMYNAATLFLYPSLRESFGLPILEAMACGLPVITSTTSSMPEVAGKAAVLVDPYSYKAIAEAMASLVSNENERLFYKTKGLERSRHFTWEASAKKFLSVYERMK